MIVENPVFHNDGWLDSCESCPLQELPLTACFHFGGINADTCPTKESYPEAVRIAKEYGNDK